MANEFKIKKGLIVTGASGGTVVDIQGSQGQLFSVTDDLSGSIFAVSDISGVPILDVNSSGLSTFSDNVVIGSVDSVVTGLNIGEASPTIQLFDTTNDGKLLMYMQDSSAVIGTYSNHSLKLFSDSTLALTINTSQNATFVGSVVTPTIITDNVVAKTTSGNITFKNNGGNTIAQFANNKSATFQDQVFATVATSSGDGSSTLTTKGYVDGLITGATIYRGAWDPSGGGYGSPDLSGVTQTSGYYYICSAAGTAEPNGTGTEPDTWAVGDWVIYNDVSGTGQWQKIDNSSVLSGAGTGQTVALWEGAGSVTDSETLGNAPITVSGNNTTFTGAGAVIATGLFRGDTLNNQANTHNMIYRSGTTTFIAGGDKLVVEDGGHVGVGIADPISKFQVVDTAFPQVRINEENNAGESGIRLRSTDGTDDYHADIVANSTGGAAGYLAFRSNHSNERMRINSTGAIQFNAYGAGTLVSDASGNITVSSGGGAGGPYLPLSAGSSYPLTGTLYLGNVGGDQKIQFQRTGGNVYSIEHDSAQLYFYNRTTTEAPLVIQNDGDVLMNAGNVGIGTTNPGSLLSLGNAVDAQKLLLYDNSDFNKYGFGIQSNEFRQFYPSNSFLSIGTISTVDGSTYAERMRIIYNGNVGIGTTSPDAKLDIEGDFEAGYALKFTNTKGTGSVSGFRSHGTNGEVTSLYRNSTEIQGWNENGNSYFNGNVGIGTGSPQSKLHIVDTDGANIILNSNTGAENNGIWMTEGGVATPYVNGAYFHYDSANNLVRLNTGTTTLSTRFVVQRDTGKFIVGGVTANQTQSVMSSRQNGSSIEFGHLNQSGRYYGTLGAMSSSGSPFIAFSADNSVSNSFTTRGAKGFVISQDTGISGDLIFSSVPLANTANQGLVERMRINSSGNVGIGTASPSFGTGGGLQITNATQANLRFTDTSASTFITDLALSNDDFYIINRASSGQLKFRVNASNEAMTIDSNGNVGIGTTSPGYPFSLESATTGLISRIYNTNADGQGLLIRAGATTSATRVFQAASSDDTKIMTVNSNGNVGIGTTSPSTRLEVSASATTSVDIAHFSNSNGSAKIKHSLDGVGSGQISIFDASNNEDIRLSTQSDSWFNAGNVGIGTTSPSAKLDIHHFTSGGNDDLLNIGLDATNPTRAKIYTENYDGNFGLWDSGSTQQVKVSSDGNSYFNGGNVGIGTTSPSSKLNISSASYNDHITLTRASDELGISVSGGQLTFEGGVSPFNNNDKDLGRSDKHWREAFVYSLRSGGALQFKTNGNNERMRITSAGNVGIGVTSPIGKLNVSKDSTTDGLSQAITVSSSSVSTKRMNLGYVPGSNYAFIDVINYAISNTNQALSLQPNGGNVGIGTTSPLAKLDIQGTQGQLFSVTDDLSGSIFAVADISGVPIFDVNSSGVSYFDGNVGIGTTSPGAKLDVVGDVYLRQTTFTNIVRPYSTQQLTLLGGGANTLFINGNVGIGTTSPTSALGSTKVLDISSTGNGEVILDHTDAGTGSDLGLYSWARSNDHLAHIKATCEGATDAAFISFHAQPSGGSFTNAASNEKMRISSSGNVTIQGTTTATNFILSSDERLKENIEKACDNRIKADWKTFELKTDKGQKRYGVIAQELEKTNPEFVREDTQGFKSVAYIDLLIAKIAELEARLEKAGI